MSVIVASYGGGTNSTAMLVGMVERGEKVDYKEIGRIVAQGILLVHARRIQEWMP